MTRRILMLVAACALLGAAAANAGGFSLPAYETTELDNGLTLVLMEQHEVPLIDVQVLVGGGAMVDGERAGLAAVTSEGLLFGAGDRTKQDLDELFDFRGARVRTWASREYAVLQASLAARDAGELLPVLRDMLVRPDFAADELGKYLERHLAGLAQAKESPRAVISDYFHRLVLGDHPYAAPTEGTEASIGALDRAAVQAHHAAWYQPQNTIVCVVGDFEASAMKAQLVDLFAAWKRGDAVLPAVPPLEFPDRARVLLVDKPDAGEATFQIGGPGIALDNPDRVGLTVVNTILGGRFTSWLNDELRVNAGLTYGARSGFVSYGHGGLFRISTFTRTATTFEAIDLAREVYGRLWEQGIDAETLASAKAYVKGQFPPRYETGGQLASFLAEMHFHGLGSDYIDRFEETVEALDGPGAAHLVETWFPRQNMQMVVIGKADELRDELARYGEVIEVEIAADGFAF